MDNIKVKKAKEIARKYHTGQVYNKKKYYNAHLIPVMELAAILAPEELKEDVMVTALLHDILEDTNCDPVYIKTTFGEDILMSVVLLTKSAEIGYEQYLRDISKNRIAKIVKIADRLVNIYNLKDIKDEAQKEKLLKKYENQITYIQEFF